MKNLYESIFTAVDRNNADRVAGAAIGYYHNNTAEFVCKELSGGWHELIIIIYPEKSTQVIDIFKDICSLISNFRGDVCKLIIGPGTHGDADKKRNIKVNIKSEIKSKVNININWCTGDGSVLTITGKPILIKSSYIPFMAMGGTKSTPIMLYADALSAARDIKDKELQILYKALVSKCNYDLIIDTHIICAQPDDTEGEFVYYGDRSRHFVITKNGSIDFDIIYRGLPGNLEQINANDITESLDDVKPKWHPKDGLFSEKDPQAIASYLLSHSKTPGQAMQRLVFYMNRAGDDCPNKTVLNKVKNIIHNKES